MKALLSSSVSEQQGRMPRCVNVLLGDQEGQGDRDEARASLESQQSQELIKIDNHFKGR